MMLWIAYPILPRYASIFLFQPLDWQSRGSCQWEMVVILSSKAVKISLSHCTVLIVAYINSEFLLHIWVLPLYIAFVAKQGYRMFQHKRVEARLILLCSAQQFSSAFPEWFKLFLNFLWSKVAYSGLMLRYTVSKSKSSWTSPLRMSCSRSR